MTRGRTPSLLGIEMWLAIHDACPWPGCGDCVQDEELAVDDDLWATVVERASKMRFPPDVLLLYYLYEGVRAAGF